MIVRLLMGSTGSATGSTSDDVLFGAERMTERLFLS